jgi:hypothetical protein
MNIDNEFLLQRQIHLLLELERYLEDVMSICHTPFRDSWNEASIRVPRMFQSHV